MITNYAILESRTTADLAALVEASLKDGRQPYGPPFYNQLGGSYCQAIVKEAAIGGSQTQSSPEPRKKL